MQSEILRLGMHLFCAGIALGIIVVIRKWFKYREEMNPVNKAMEAYNADYNRVSKLIETAEEKDRMALHDKIDAIEKQYTDKLPDHEIKMGTFGLKAKLEVKLRIREGIVKAITPTNSVG